MGDEIRRPLPPRPGYISGEEDMLHDMDAIDRQNEGIMTPMKIASIKRFLKLGGTLADPARLAANFKVSIEDVKRVIGESEA
jgi:hypothetical protein